MELLSEDLRWLQFGGHPDVEKISSQLTTLQDALESPEQGRSHGDTMQRSRAGDHWRGEKIKRWGCLKWIP